MIKVGDKFISRINIGSIYTKNKIYVVNKIAGCLVYLTGDNGDPYYFLLTNNDKKYSSYYIYNNFISIKEIRKNKLDKLSKL
jgi:hypothetical protein